MFTVGDTNNSVYEYALSTAFDISSLSYTDNLSIGSEESSPTGIKFNHDGTKMYISGSSGDDINEYTLSTAFDISSTVTHKGSYDVSSSDGGSGATGFSFNNDGTKLFTTGSTNDRANEHSLTTPFSLVDVSGEHSGDVINTSSTDNYDTDPDSDTLTVTAIRTGSVEGSGTAGSVGSALTGTYGDLTIAANGSYTYEVADNSTMDALDAGDIVTDTFNYTVSDGQGETDIATITITITGINDAPTAVADTDTVTANATVTDTTNSAGTLVSDDSDPDASASLYITQVTPSGGSATSVTYNSTKTSSAATITGSKGTLTIGSDGSYSYAANSDASVGDDVFTYTLTDGTSTTTSTLTITIYVNSAPVAQNDTGTVNENATLSVSNSDNATTVTGVSNDTGSPYAINEGTVRSVTFNHDGTKMFVVHAANGTPKISEHALTTAFDIDTSSQSTTYDISSHLTEPRGIRFNNDGTKLYISSGANSNKKIYEFSLSTAYDVSSLPTATETSISGQDSGPRGFSFNADGTKMFLIGDTNNAVYEYSLSTAFDTTTISYTNRSLDISSREVTPRGLSFNPTGTKLFITGQNSDDILEYDLSTGFDLSTATFNGAFDVSSFATKPNDIVFNNDGTKAFMARANNNGVRSFSLTSPYSFIDISGEHTGDVLDTSSSSNSDSDTNTNDTLTVSAIRTGGTEGAGTAGSVGSALTGTYGQLTINANGSYSYAANTAAAEALDAGDVVTDQFNYTVSDGTATDTAVITITVIGINDAPTASNGTVYINENNQVSSAGDRTPSNITKLFVASDFNFTDDDASASLLKVKITTLESAGALEHFDGSSWNDVTLNQEITATDIGNSYLRFTPAANSEDDVTFGFKVHDGTAYSSSAYTMTISVNAAPNVTDTTISGTVAAGATTSSADIHDIVADSDDDDSVLVVTGVAAGNESTNNTIQTSGGIGGAGVSGTYGTLTVAADGTYTYTASSSNNIAKGSTATDTFTFTTRDDEGSTGSAGSHAYDVGTITFTVASSAVNTAPTASNSTIYINENNQVSSAGDRTPSNITHTFSTSDFNYSDSDSDSFSKVKITTLENASYGALEYSSDGSTWTDVTLNQEITAADIGNNRLRFTPTANSESNTSFGFRVHDGYEYSSFYVMSISVNSAPNVTDTTISGTVAAGATTSSADIHDIVADTDDSDSVLVVTGVASGNESSNNTIITNDTGVGSAVTGSYGSITVAADGTYTYTASSTNNIAYGETATDTFTFTTRDDETNSGSFAYDIGTITFTIASSLGLTADTDTVNEDATVTVNDGDSEDVLEDDTSASSVSHIGTAVDSLTAITGSQSVTGTYGTLTMYSTGAYSYVADQSASDALTSGATADDVFYYQAGGATTTLTITVTGIGPLAANDTANVNEDATATGTAGVSGTGVLGNDDGNASYDTESLRVTRVSTDNFSTATTVDDDDNADTIDGTYGTLTIYKTGQYSYTPDNATAQALAQDASVTDTFYYEIKDDSDVNASTATLIFTITGQNDAPTVSSAPTVYINENNQVSSAGDRTPSNISKVFAASDFNFSDVDAGASISKIKITGLETSGTLEYTTDGSTWSDVTENLEITAANLGNGYLKFTPAANSEDDVTFTYQVHDGSAYSSLSYTMTISVNAAPNVTDTTISGTVAAGATTSSADIHTIVADSDDDDSVLVVTGVAAGNESSNNTIITDATGVGGSGVSGTYGTLTVASDGTYTYAASSTNSIAYGATATDTFTFTTRDDESSSGSYAYDVGTITFTVASSISLTDDTDSVNEDETVTKTAVHDDVLNDDTADTNGLVVTHIGTGSNSDQTVASGSTYNTNSPTSITGTYGTLTIGADGSYTYTADQSASDSITTGTTANDIFTYTADGATATLTITVTGVNDAPTVVNDTDSVTEGGTVDETTNSAGTVLSDDSDVDGDTLTVSGTVTQTSATANGGSSITISSPNSGSVGSAVTGYYGQLTLDSDGTYSYVANQSNADALDDSESGTDVFTFTVSDGTTTTSSTITFTVNGANDAPTASNNTVTTNEDTTYTFTASDFGFSDVDGDTLSSVTVKYNW